MALLPRNLTKLVKSSLPSLPQPVSVVDAHVHFWDPGSLRYPWLDGIRSLRRRFAPDDLARDTADVPLDGIIFVECNCAPEQAGSEVEMVAELAADNDRLLGIVAFADLTQQERLGEVLDRYRERALVRGIRHNIQGHEPGYCLRPDFVEGVREVGRSGFTFDLCATHDQLPEVIELAAHCPETRLVLDHCGKPDIASRSLDPWRDHIRELAGQSHVWCKLSGLLTESGPAGWREEDLLPYADHVVDSFGIARMIYGGDWPVVTLAGTYHEWYEFTRRFTGDWNAGERAAFFRGNALLFYGIRPRTNYG